MLSVRQTVLKILDVLNITSKLFFFSNAMAPVSRFNQFYTPYFCNICNALLTLLAVSVAFL